MVAVNNNENMKFTKTETEYNMKSIRFLLLTITSMFIAIAMLLIVLGNSVYSHYHTYTFFYESLSVGRYITPSVLCVFLGLTLLLISLFGFFGSLKKSTCMVNMYAFVLILVFIFKLVVVCVAFTTNGDALWNSLEIPVWDVQDPEIQAEVDFMQNSLGCCGSTSYKDYMYITLPANMSTVVIAKVIDGNPVTMVVPASCCAIQDVTVCPRMWSLGCKDALVQLMVQNSTVIGVLGVSIMFINLLGIIFALLLARCIRKMKSEKTMMAWKAKEQMIMARQAEDMFKQEQNNHVFIDHQTSSVA